MSAEQPDDIDRAAIEEAAQRTAERTALRKVRKQLDSIEQAEARQRKLLRIALLVGAIVIVVLALVVWQMIARNRELHRGPPIEIPKAAEKKS